MKKRMFLVLLMLLTAVLTLSVISASEVNVTDSNDIALADDTSDVSVPLDDGAGSPEVSISCENVSKSGDSNILSSDSKSDEVVGDTDMSIDDNVSSKVDPSKTIVAKDTTKYYKGNTKYSAKFLDEYGNPLANADVKITVKGVSYTKKTNANGVASLAVNLKPGTYKVVAANPVTGYQLTTTFKILSTIVSKDISKVQKDSRKFTAKFYKANGKVLAKKTVKFKLNKKTYKVKTNSKGVATLSLKSLKKGTYKIKSFNTDGLSKTNKIKVVKSTTTHLSTSSYTFLKKDTKKIKVTLLNGFGYNCGKGKVVKFKLNGKTYSSKTNAKGVATLKLPSLKVGQHTVKYVFAGKGAYKKSSASNKVLIISTKNPTFTLKSATTFGYGANTPFKVALTAGSIPLAKRTVDITVDGKTYTKTTDNKGIVSLPIKLAVGNYTVVCKNKAESKVNSKTYSQNIIVKQRAQTTLTWEGDTSFNQSSQTFKVLLKDSNNTVLGGKTVKVTVGTKSYTAVTSSSGYATFNLNLSSGNYNVSCKYEANGDNDNAPSSTMVEVKVDFLNGYGYWVYGSDMKNVNLNTLASKGTTDLFLNYYAIDKFGQSAVEKWISNASALGMRVHILMNAFYDGDWVNPVKDGAPNQAFFNQKITEAKKYAKIKGVSGIHIDYLRYPGNAYKTSGGISAINEFVKQITQAIHDVDSDLIVSCALMPETTDNEYYYGQDLVIISQYMDVVIPQIFKGNYESGTSWIKSTTKWFVDNSKGAKVWCGLMGYESDDNTVKLSSTEIKSDSQAAIKGGASGVIIYRSDLTNLVSFNSLEGYLGTSA